MLLTDVDSGTTVTITKIDAGRSLIGRLAAMGLISGSRIKVSVNDRRGPVVVTVKESRIALGRGMAERITVRAEKEPQ